MAILKVLTHTSSHRGKIPALVARYGFGNKRARGGEENLIFLLAKYAAPLYSAQAVPAHICGSAGRVEEALGQHLQADAQGVTQSTTPPGRIEFDGEPGKLTLPRVLFNVTVCNRGLLWVLLACQLPNRASACRRFRTNEPAEHS